MDNIITAQQYISIYFIDIYLLITFIILISSVIFLIIIEHVNELLLDTKASLLDPIPFITKYYYKPMKFKQVVAFDRYHRMDYLSKEHMAILKEYAILDFSKEIAKYVKTEEVESYDKRIKELHMELYLYKN